MYDKKLSLLILFTISVLYSIPSTFAASHREAPLIALDPAADTTDVYAFRSWEDPNKVVFILNTIPGQDPADGPNYFSFDDNVLYQFHIDNDLEVNELKLPGMLTQPFVENAIEHGFKDIDYIGKIDIYFEEKKQNVLITIEDNGKGVNVLETEKEHKSRAMQIVKDRLYLFNKQHKSAAYYNIEDTNKTGFKIRIVLPKIY